MLSQCCVGRTLAQSNETCVVQLIVDGWSGGQQKLLAQLLGHEQNNSEQLARLADLG